MMQQPQGPPCFAKYPYSEAPNRCETCHIIKMCIEQTQRDKQHRRSLIDYCDRKDRKQ
ncbi:MAG: hypothetical protein IAX22_02610 [Candidatus Bathyarchaeota archaeon]|nr:hypothetical protein [Candidatus Bathyarchaeota archaeon]